MCFLHLRIQVILTKDTHQFFILLFVIQKFFLVKHKMIALLLKVLVIIISLQTLGRLKIFGTSGQPDIREDYESCQNKKGGSIGLLPAWVQL